MEIIDPDGGLADPDFRKRRGYIEQHDAGKRLGLRWTPWMGDWFNSWSPRNHNSNGEGEWDQWVDLAIMILQDPLTELTRPAAHAAVQGLGIEDYYTGSNRPLADEELAARFATELAQPDEPEELR